MRGIRLSIKLPAFVVLAVLLMAAAGSLLAIFIGRSTLRTRELGHNVEAANVYASAVNSYLESARSILETTVGLSEIKDFTTVRLINPALHGIPASVDKPKHKVAGLILKHSEIFEYVMLLQANGSVYMLEPYDLQIKLSHHNLAFTAWYKKLMSTGKPVISDLHISPATQRPTVVIATPVHSSAGKIIGIWAGALKLEEFSLVGRDEFWKERLLHYGYITDSQGLIIAHQTNLKYVEEQTDFSSVPPVQAALSGQRGATQFINPIEREEKLGAYLPLSGSGWTVVYVIPTTIAFAPINELVRNIILIAAGLAALLGFVSWIIVRQIVRPLGQLTAAAATIGTGNFTQRIELRTDDEIGKLSEEFNRMAVALFEKEANLRQHTAQLEAANKELEAFSYSVSHDLRAPLRAIDGFSRVILEDYTDKLDDEGKRYLNIIGSNTKKMGQLIDDLLVFSRLGRQEIRVSEMDMGELAKAVSDELKLIIPERKIHFTIKPLSPIHGDQAMIRQVFVNLLSNAVKFTRPKENATIEVGGEREGNENIYYVKDNGVGFDMQYVNKLFGVFQRLHSSEEFEGTGVGLAIVQRIIHRHGGRVWAEGKVGEGATFYFTLPRERMDEGQKIKGEG
jgi:two-component system sensor kinase